MDDTATLTFEVTETQAAWSDLVSSLAHELADAGLGRADLGGEIALDCFDCQVGDGSCEGCGCAC